MHRPWRYVLAAVVGAAVTTGLAVPAHAARQPKPTIVVGNVTTPIPPVAVGDTQDFTIDGSLIMSGLGMPSPGTVDHIADVHLTSGPGRIATTSDPVSGSATVTYFAPVPLSARPVGASVAVVTYDAVTTIPKGPRNLPTPFTSAPATATVRILPFAAAAPGVTLLAPGATAASSSLVVAGGLQNVDEFATATQVASGVGFGETFQVSAHSNTCDISVGAPAVALGQGQTATFSLRADPGSWVLVAHSITTGQTTTRAFTVGRIGTGRYCSTPTSVLGITLTRNAGSSGPGDVAPYGGTANGALPQGTPGPRATSSTGFSAAVRADQNPAYDATQAAAGATGCHSVGTGANAHFVGCDDITASPGTANTGNVLTGTPAIVAYVILFLAALLLLGGLARRARTAA